MDISHTDMNVYGKFKNVYLTEEEYKQVLKNHWEERLESMSEWKDRRGLIDFTDKTDFERMKTWMLFS